MCERESGDKGLGGREKGMGEGKSEIGELVAWCGLVCKKEWVDSMGVRKSRNKGMGGSEEGKGEEWV